MDQQIARRLSTEAVKKKAGAGSKIKKTLLWTAALSVPAYMGATVYAQEDLEFKRFFRESVPGGSECLAAYKSLYGPSKPEKKTAEKTSAEKADKTTDKAADKPADKAASEKVPEKNVEKASEAPVKKTVVKGAAPAANQGLEAFSTRLASIIDEFGVIVKTGSKAGSEVPLTEDFFKRISEELEELTAHADSLLQSGLLDAKSVQQSKQFISAMEQEIKAFVALSQREATKFEAKLKAARDAWESEKTEALKTELEKQKGLDQAEAQKALEEKKTLWEAEWNRGLRKRLEEERGERLARLEALELKMKILEAKTLEASDFARDQKRCH